MYKRYQISIPQGEGVFSNEYYYNKGTEYLEEISNSLESKAKEFKKIKGHIDASSMMDNWFPNISSHVFISHSHTDEKQVIMLCGWLKDKLGIDSFVDSKLWGYSDKLLRVLDSNYSNSISGNTYDYKKRNISTSHVHVMLMSSLIKMIDKAECLIFVNTESSVAFGKAIEEEMTLSPWIYSELSVSNIMKVDIPPRRRGVVISTESAKADSVEVYAEDSAMTALYDISKILKGIKEIPLSALRGWEKNPKDTPEDNLDWLYDNYPSGSRYE